jgi:hypothetical protein
MSCVVLRCCALVLALVLGACEGDGATCAAACINSLDVALHAEEWPSGEYVLVARYDAHRRSYVANCTFTLPSGGEDVVCEDGSEEFYKPELSIGATVALHLPVSPPRLELELQPPTGEVKSFALTPPYDEHELCSQTCRTGSVTVSLDEEVP